MVKTRYTREEVLAKAKKLFNGLDLSEETQLGKLTHAYAQKNYDWFSSARTLFGRIDTDWYDALEKLMAEIRSPEAAKVIIERIRIAGKKSSVDAASENNLKYTAEQVRSSKALAGSQNLPA